jgi:hypothetical protein
MTDAFGAFAGLLDDTAVFPPGTCRWPRLLSAGMSIDGVLADYPDLRRDDLLAALEFGALVAGGAG